MSGGHWANVFAGIVLLAALFLGLVVRRRYRACYSFALYVPAVLLPQLLLLLWPHRFFRWDFWLLKETVHQVLKFAIALELAYRTFHAFPGAQATARRVLFAVVVVMYLGVLAVPAHRQADYATYTVLADQVFPRVLNGTAWLFTAIAALILWYRLPVDPFQKAILIGFVPYLLTFTVGLNALHSLGWGVRESMAWVHTAAYTVLEIYWNYAAWRRDKGLVDGPRR